MAALLLLEQGRLLEVGIFKMTPFVNLLESFLAKLNESIFYREFSFSRNDFHPRPGEKKEFADHVVWIDDFLIIFQLKQRSTGKATSEATERNWFENKVLGKATRQIKDTLGFLDQFPQITIANRRGHVFDLNRASVKHLIKIIVYDPGENLPSDCLRTLHYLSSKVGFIHVIPWRDYAGLCVTLLTQDEFVDYLEFREALIEKWHKETDIPSERALVGQFLASDKIERPDEGYARFLENLKRETQKFNITYLLNNIGDRLDQATADNKPLDYYKILAEFAKLNRGDLKEVKARIVACLKAIREDRFMQPTRIIVPRSGCGFVFIPLPQDAVDFRRNALHNLTLAAKYEHQFQKQVGVTLVKEEEFILMDWCYMESTWARNPVLEEMLRTNNPFGALRAELRNIYEFDE